MNTNPPTYVRIRPVTKRCQGAGFFSISQNVFLPTTLYFGYVMRREYPDKDTWDSGKLGDKPGNAYFHSRDLACLKRISELSNVNETHIYIEDGIYHSLSEGTFGVIGQMRALGLSLQDTCKIDSKEMI